jgi:TonB family protein
MMAVAGRQPSVRRLMASVALLAVALLARSDAATPARIVAPHLPPGTDCGAEVLLHVKLDASGAPEGILGILDVSPFAETLREAVRQWRLPAPPAGDSARDVLVAGMFRAACLLDLEVLRPPPPAALAPRVLPYPIQWERPPYPPHALGDAVVVVEVRVGEDGVARAATVASSAPGFDDAAVETARRWRFRPAVRDDRPVPAVAYLVFGFRAPLIVPGPRG